MVEQIKREELEKASWTRFILPVVVLGIAVLIGMHLLRSKPKATRQPQPPKKTYVEAYTLATTNSRVILELMGTVKPTIAIDLKPRVSGEIVSISPKLNEGDCFEKDEVMLKIEQRDFELDIIQSEAQLAQAEHDYMLELGEQEMGKYYWSLVDHKITNNTLQSELTLRKPQLKKAQANVASARARLEEDKLNLDRTTIRAPFNCVVAKEFVDRGAQIALGNTIAELVGIDQYSVDASIPLDRLKWLYNPVSKDIAGRHAMVEYPNQEAGTTRWAAVTTRYKSHLIEKGRMGQISLTIDDPRGLKAENKNRSPLLLGSYVKVEVEGSELKDVFVIPRSALRDDDMVWLVDADSKLIFQKVKPEWKDRDRVYIYEGLKNGDMLITSDIGTPVIGLSLQVENNEK